jgi:pimeloyl-ACP methyl ester carboxylesterase
MLLRALRAPLRLCIAALLFLSLPAPAAAADNAAVGVIVMHGKWGSPQGLVNGLADALQSQGFLVANPEMPWSGRRSYDKSVDGADAEIDAEIAKLRDKGAKQIFLVGHSLGAAYALHYASRTTVNGMVAIAPGHIPEGRRYTELYADEVRKARELVAAGKSDEMVWFLDFNTGNRRDRIKASAASFLSYFDPAGPMNMTRNVTTVKPGVPLLWMVPTREEQPLRDGMVSLYGNLPSNPGNQFIEPDSDHLQAPAVATPQIIDWIRAVAAKN